jgi:hypothetical protein
MNIILFFDKSIANFPRLVLLKNIKGRSIRFSWSAFPLCVLNPVISRQIEWLSSSWKGGNAMKELIEYIAKALVDHPEQVSVNVLEGSQATILELNVAKEDLGKVIGKQGRTAKAIRTILGATSAKQKKRTVLEIVE